MSPRRDRDLLRKYGITYAEFLAMFARQGGKCSGCRRRFESESKAHIDHDHATGKVRALLCLHCNTALGLASECKHRLRRMATYAEAFEVARVIGWLDMWELVGEQVLWDFQAGVRWAKRGRFD